MDKARIFELLRQNSEELEGFGVERIGIFGSYAREDAGEESDLDFLVVFREGEKNYHNYIGLKRFLDGLFDREIDLATKQSLKPSIRDKVVGEVEYAETA